jgi:hypothetical protein
MFASSSWSRHAISAALGSWRRSHKLFILQPGTTSYKEQKSVLPRSADSYPLPIVSGCGRRKFSTVQCERELPGRAPKWIAGISRKFFLLASPRSSIGWPASVCPFRSPSESTGYFGKTLFLCRDGSVRSLLPNLRVAAIVPSSEAGIPSSTRTRAAE